MLGFFLVVQERRLLLLAMLVVVVHLEEVALACHFYLLQTLLHVLSLLIVRDHLIFPRFALRQLLMLSLLVSVLLVAQVRIKVTVLFIFLLPLLFFLLLIPVSSVILRKSVTILGFHFQLKGLLRVFL